MSQGAELGTHFWGQGPFLLVNMYKRKMWAIYNFGDLGVLSIVSVVARPLHHFLKTKGTSVGPQFQRDGKAPGPLEFPGLNAMNNKLFWAVCLTFSLLFSFFLSFSFEPLRVPNHFWAPCIAGSEGAVVTPLPQSHAIAIIKSK